MASTRKGRARTTPAKPVGLPTPEEYNAFLAGVELLTVRLVFCDLKAGLPYLGGDRKVELIEAAPRYRRTPGGFVAYFSAGLTCTNGEDEEELTEEQLTIVMVVFELEYSSTAVAVDDRLWAVFREYNLPLNAWPYVREALQSTLGRAGWPAVVLPARRSVPANEAAP